MILIEAATVANRSGKVRKEAKRGPENTLAMSSPAPEQHHTTQLHKYSKSFLSGNEDKAGDYTGSFQRVYPGNI